MPSGEAKRKVAARARRVVEFAVSGRHPAPNETDTPYYSEGATLQETLWPGRRLVAVVLQPLSAGDLCERPQDGHQLQMEAASSSTACLSTALCRMC